MKIIKAIILVLTLATIFTIVAGCENETTPQQVGDNTLALVLGEADFNIIFKYGVGARNELDTFLGTYTKDMVADPPVTTELRLTKEERDTIYRKMLEIDFFDYPDKYSIDVPPGEPIGIATPYSSYYFRVEYDSLTKELWWSDKITNPDEQADRLRELIILIRTIVESKEEYQELPEPTSGYL